MEFAKAPTTNWREIISWIFYGIGYGAFNKSILNGWFGPYLASIIEKAQHGNVNPFGPGGFIQIDLLEKVYSFVLDPKFINPYAIHGINVAFGVLGFVLLFPFIGPIGDYGNKTRRNLLLTFSFSGMLATLVMYFLDERTWILGSPLFVIAFVSANYSNTYFNSYLPLLARAKFKTVQQAKREPQRVESKSISKLIISASRPESDSTQDGTWEMPHKSPRNTPRGIIFMHGADSTDFQPSTSGFTDRATSALSDTTTASNKPPSFSIVDAQSEIRSSPSAPAQPLLPPSSNPTSVTQPSQRVATRHTFNVNISPSSEELPPQQQIGDNDHYPRSLPSANGDTNLTPSAVPSSQKPTREGKEPISAPSNAENDQVENNVSRNRLFLHLFEEVIEANDDGIYGEKAVSEDLVSESRSSRTFEEDQESTSSSDISVPDTPPEVPREFDEAGSLQEIHSPRSLMKRKHRQSLNSNEQLANQPRNRIRRVIPAIKNDDDSKEFYRLSMKSMAVGHDVIAEYRKRKKKNTIDGIASKLSLTSFIINFITSLVLMLLNLALLQIVPRLSGDSSSSDAPLAKRLIFFLAGVWWFIFVIPSLLYLKARPGAPLPDGQRYLTASLQRVRVSFRHIGKLKHTYLYLLAYMFFGDSFTTFSLTATLSGKQIINASDLFLSITLFMTFITAVCGSFGFMLLHDRFPSVLTKKRVLMICIAILCVCALYTALLLRWHESEVLVFGVMFGVAYGGYFTFGISQFTELIPKGVESQFYSIYQILGCSMLCPLVFSIISQIMKNLRWANGAIFVWGIVGMVVLSFTNIERAKKDASVFHIMEIVQSELARVQEEIANTWECPNDCMYCGTETVRQVVNINWGAIPAMYDQLRAPTPLPSASLDFVEPGNDSHVVDINGPPPAPLENNEHPHHQERKRFFIPSLNFGRSFGQQNVNSSEKDAHFVTHRPPQALNVVPRPVSLSARANRSHQQQQQQQQQRRSPRPSSDPTPPIALIQ